MSRRSPLLAALLALLIHEAVLADCSIEPPSDSPQYVHKHKVYNFNGEPPDWVEDNLVLWNPSSDETCFALNTWGPMVTGAVRRAR